MPTIGIPELVIIGMILVLVFGASRLPKLGENAGKIVRQLSRQKRTDSRIAILEETRGDSKSSGVTEASRRPEGPENN